MGPREDKPKSRTAAATAAAKRRAEERRADYLRERGWTCIAPGAAPAPRPYVVDMATGETTGGPKDGSVQHWDRETFTLTIHSYAPELCHRCAELEQLADG